MKRVFEITSAACLLLAACAPAAMEGPSGINYQLLADEEPVMGTWRIYQVDQRLIRDRSLSLRFGSGNQVDGSVECNTFSGTYQLLARRLIFEVATTALGCFGGDPAVRKASSITFGDHQALISSDRQFLLLQGAGSVVFRREG